MTVGRKTRSTGLPRSTKMDVGIDVNDDDHDGGEPKLITSGSSSAVKQTGVDDEVDEVDVKPKSRAKDKIKVKAEDKAEFENKDKIRMKPITDTTEVKPDRQRTTRANSRINNDNDIVVAASAENTDHTSIQPRMRTKIDAVHADDDIDDTRTQVKTRKRTRLGSPEQVVATETENTDLTRTQVKTRKRTRPISPEVIDEPTSSRLTQVQFKPITKTKAGKRTRPISPEPTDEPGSDQPVQVQPQPKANTARRTRSAKTITSFSAGVGPKVEANGSKVQARSEVKTTISASAEDEVEGIDGQVQAGSSSRKIESGLELNQALAADHPAVTDRLPPRKKTKVKADGPGVPIIDVDKVDAKAKVETTDQAQSVVKRSKGKKVEIEVKRDEDDGLDSRAPIVVDYEQEDDEDDKVQLPTTHPAPTPLNSFFTQPNPNTSKAQVGRAQTIKPSKHVHIPVDEEFEYHVVGAVADWKVYVGVDGLVWDASLNQTNAGKNSNKFYKVQLLHNPIPCRYNTWTRWGRVGERGQHALLGAGSIYDAQSQFEKKFKDKTGLKWADRAGDVKAGKYAYVEKSYQPDTDDEAEGDDDDVDMGQAGPSTTDKGKKKASTSADQPEPKSTLAKPVQNLLGLLFSQQYQQEALLSLNYDTEKMPLGKLSKGTISRGFQALKDLATIINANVVDAQQIEPLSNRYYSLIPHTFGRNRPPVINTHERLKQEIELLESLSDMKEANDMFKEANREIENNHLSRLDRQYETLGMDEVEPVDGRSTEWKELVDYLVKTKGETHHLDYDVQDIFRIQRKGESERFHESPFAKVATPNRRLLWHGSRVTNFAGILSQGLRIAPPEAPVSGYMFGKGIYLADMSSKSALYCASNQSGGTALLLLCEAELGDPVLELTNASYTAGQDAVTQGMSSTWGKGRVGPKAWKDAGCVHPSLAGTSMPDVSTTPGDTKVANAYLQYNEYIAYDVAQVRLRYLLRVRM